MCVASHGAGRMDKAKERAGRAQGGVRPIGRQRRHCRGRPGRRSRYSLPRRRPRRATGSARKFAQGNLGQDHAGQAHAGQAHARQAHAGQYRAPPAVDFRAAHPRPDRHARPPDRCQLPRPDPLPRRRAEGRLCIRRRSGAAARHPVHHRFHQRRVRNPRPGSGDCGGSQDHSLPPV